MAQSVCDVAADTTGAQARVALANAADGAVLCRHDLVLHDRHGQWFRRQRDLVAVHRSGLGHRYVQPVSQGVAYAQRHDHVRFLRSGRWVDRGDGAELWLDLCDADGHFVGHHLRGCHFVLAFDARSRFRVVDRAQSRRERLVVLAMGLTKHAFSTDHQLLRAGYVRFLPNVSGLYFVCAGATLYRRCGGFVAVVDRAGVAAGVGLYRVAASPAV